MTDHHQPMVARTGSVFPVKPWTSTEIAALADDALNARRGRPRKLPDEQIARLKEIRRQRRAIPTDKELARELGVGVRVIQDAMRGA